MDEKRVDREVSDKERARAKRIEEKQARGETLTRHEAGVLGGAERTREAGD